MILRQNLCYSCIIFLLMLQQVYAQTHTILPEEGMVPNSQTAIILAETLLKPILGQAFLDQQQSISANLKDNVWVVTGSLSTKQDAETVLIEISKTDAKVLRIVHSKSNYIAEESLSVGEAASEISANTTTLDEVPTFPTQPLPTRKQANDWSGSYAGIQFGGGFGHSERFYSEVNTTTGNFPTNGLLGGITLGYNQPFGHVVVGVESDFSVNGTAGLANRPNPSYLYRTQTPWFSTFRLRLGYQSDNLLPYLTAGLVLANEHISSYATNGSLGSDFSRIELGWTAGAGIEKLLSANLSVKAEYLYTQSNRVEGSSSSGSPTFTNVNENIGRLGLNLKFDPATVTASSLFWPDTGVPTRIGVSTLSGVELGGQISNYRYQEQVVANYNFMHETAAKFGLTALATQTFGRGLFVSEDIRLAYSSNDYSSPGSGTLQNIPEYLWETRLLGGKDFLFSHVFNWDVDFSLAPYVGLGYRNLYNDSRGVTNLGYIGYQRNSQYFYLPVGITHRLLIYNDTRISSNLEYDYLAEGMQTSNLSDTSANLPNLHNGQYDGYALRGNLMYEQERWSIGPFFNYWNISKSAGERFNNLVGYEPHNQTLEYGLQSRYRFW